MKYKVTVYATAEAVLENTYDIEAEDEEYAREIAEEYLDADLFMMGGEIQIVVGPDITVEKAE